VVALRARTGLTSQAREADLAVLGKSIATFYGEKVAGGLCLLLWIPALRLLGVFVPLAAPWSVALGAAGFFVPNWVLASKAKAARQELRDGVAEMAVLMSLAVSAGAGIDAAFRSALEVGGGRFADEIRRARTAHLRDSVAQVIDGVAEALGVVEAASLASAIGATAHGAAVGDALDELAWAMVDDRRIEAIETGVRAGTRMVMLTAGLMVPGYVALLVFPGVRLALNAITR
jgi:tight adherence protein C